MELETFEERYKGNNSTSNPFPEVQTLTIP